MFETAIFVDPMAPKPDLLVIGAHGQTGVANAFLMICSCFEKCLALPFQRLLARSMVASG